MADIWVIEDGSYSDYRVVGVFSSESNALGMAAALGLEPDSVSQWRLDPGVEHLNEGRTLWKVAMSATGEVKKVARAEDSRLSDVPDSPEFQLYGYTSGLGLTLHATTWAADAAHAVKITNEHRIQLRAQGKW